MEFHTNQVNAALNPVRFTLTLLGRWPLSPTTQTVTRIFGIGFESGFSKSQKLQKLLKIQVFNSSSLISPLWIYFLITSLFLVSILLMSVVGFCNFFLGWNTLPKIDWDEEEKENFKTNVVPFVLVWSSLLHSSISSISFFINRKKLVKLLNYSNVAIDQMEIQIPKKLKIFVWTNHLGFLIFVVTLCFVGYKIFYWNLVRGGGLLIGIVTLRPILPFLGLDKHLDLWKVRVFGVLLYILVFSIIAYATYASRVMLILFRFHCKLLTHGFTVLNHRLKKFLKYSATATTVDSNEQWKCEKLTNDYRILLKLFHLTNFVFGPVLSSYYSSQLLSMCFELYYLSRSGSSEQNKGDVFAAIAVLIQNLYIFFTLSLDAAEVSERAIRGVDILNSNPIRPFQDTIHKKYLVTNMRTMFSQRIVLTGSKYFSLDRPFIVSVLGAVFTYFIIILQLGPSLHNENVNVSL